MAVREKRYLSDERVATAMLEYLVWRRENKKPGCSVYDIAKNAPGLTSTQRHQRLNDILGQLEGQGLVKGDKFERATYHHVTDAGYAWYKNIAKAFWDALSGLYPPANP